MVLIPCYECSKQISHRAPACPICGAPADQRPAGHKPVTGTQVTYHKNGHPKTIKTYRDTVLDGPSESYYEDGQPKQTGVRRNGRWDGLRERYFENGQVEERQTYRNGKPHGPFEKFDEDGLLWNRGSMNEGKLDGLYESYSEFGLLIEKQIYKNGKPHGPAIEEYYESGQIKAGRSVNEGKLDGLCELYYESGQIKERRTFKDGEPHGPFEKFDEDGLLLNRGSIIDGKYDGLYESYSEFGLLIEKQIYKNGKPDGNFEEYYVEGELKEKESINDNELTEKRSYKNGLLAEKTSYKNGKPHGLYELYSEDGWLIKRRTYKNGKLNGIGLDYIEIDQLRSNHPLSNNLVQKLLDAVDDNPEHKAFLKSKSHYKEGKLHGPYVRYYPEDSYIDAPDREWDFTDLFADVGKKPGERLHGFEDPIPASYLHRASRYGSFETFYPKQPFLEPQIKSSGWHEDGKLDGILKTYYKNGQVKQDRIYEEGQLKATPKLYQPDGKQVKKDDLFPYESMAYKNGQLCGPYRLYHCGQLKTKGNYKDGKLDGIFEDYDKDGQLISSSSYDKGERYGEWFQDGKWVFYKKGDPYPYPLEDTDDYDEEYPPEHPLDSD